MTIKKIRYLALAAVFLFSPFLYADSRIEQAQTLLQQSKTNEALEVTNAILEDDPGHIEARFMKGIILTRAERLSEAETVFDELTRDHPDLPEPYNNLAVVYAAQGKFDEAKDALTRAINTHPSYATAHENLGDIYAKMASRAYNQALELDDGNTSAREKLSLIRNLFSASISTTASSSPAVEKQESSEPLAEAKPEKPIVEKSKLQPKPVVSDPVEEIISEVESVTVQQEEPDKAVVDIPLDPEIENNILDWAVAWSSQSVDDYLSYYSPDFKPSFGLSFEDWKIQRQERISKPKFINIELSNIDVVMTGENTANVKFKQSYTSDTYQDSVSKQLRMHKQNGQWKILRELSN